LALGLAHSEGHGFRKDEVAAANWFLLAAVQGISLAQMSLCAMHVYGRGVLKDYEVAHI